MGAAPTPALPSPAQAAPPGDSRGQLVASRGQLGFGHPRSGFWGLFWGFWGPRGARSLGIGALGVAEGEGAADPPAVLATRDNLELQILVTRKNLEFQVLVPRNNLEFQIFVSKNNLEFQILVSKNNLEFQVPFTKNKASREEGRGWGRSCPCWNGGFFPLFPFPDFFPSPEGSGMLLSLLELGDPFPVGSLGSSFPCHHHPEGIAGDPWMLQRDPLGSGGSRGGFIPAGLIPGGLCGHPEFEHPPFPPPRP